MAPASIEVGLSRPHQPETNSTLFHTTSSLSLSVEDQRDLNQHADSLIPMPQSFSPTLQQVSDQAVADNFNLNWHNRDLSNQYENFAGGYEIFVSGITLHFKPIWYNNIRDWVVSKLEGAYTNIQNTSFSFPDVEGGPLFSNFGSLTTEPEPTGIAEQSVSNDEQRDQNFSTSETSTDQRDASNVELPSLIYNTVSGIYYFLSSVDGRASQSESSASQGTGTVTTEGFSSHPISCKVSPIYIEEDDEEKYQQHVMTSFDESNLEDDYDVLHLDDVVGTSTPTSGSVTQENLNNSHDLELSVEFVDEDVNVISDEVQVDQAELWDIVSQDEADEWNSSSLLSARQKH
ncbi:hypothetical protein V1512DRAFT_266137 [Lipomyces arxii]|uniref:uncharacterized protein n=1 Tax=Lipomyces arxii TaxID=56418 RepID=UPI0034CDAEBF